MKVLLLSSFFLITGVFPQEVDKIQNIRGFDKIPPFVINGLKKAGLTTVCELEVALENVGGNIADLDVPKYVIAKGDAILTNLGAYMKQNGVSCPGSTDDELKEGSDKTKEFGSFVFRTALDKCSPREIPGVGTKIQTRLRQNARITTCGELVSTMWDVAMNKVDFTAWFMENAPVNNGRGEKYAEDCFDALSAWCELNKNACEELDKRPPELKLPVPDFQRTAVVVCYQTVPDQDMFLTGGNAEMEPIAIRLRDTEESRWPEYPIWAENCDRLSGGRGEDQTGQVEGLMALGVPMRWTSDEEGQENYQHELNSDLGRHCWLVDMDMDCSMTDDGWFQFAFRKLDRRNPAAVEIVDEVPVFEGQDRCEGDEGEFMPTTFRTAYHHGKCGAVNMAEFDTPTCSLISNFDEVDAH